MKSGIGALFIEANAALYIALADAYSKTLALANTFYQMTGLKTGIARNMTDDGPAGTITVKTPGRYQFTGYACSNPTSGCVLTFQLYINGQPARTATRLSFLNSQAENVFSGNGPIDLKLGDVIDMRIASDTANRTIVISNMVLNFSRIGS